MQVVPDVPTFAVDDGFAYAVPDRFRTAIEVGSVVRVPLGGRRVRGFVIGERRDAPDRLKEIQAVSGDLPVFTPRLLETLRWAAVHYVAPLAVMLAKAAPPNVPRKRIAPAYGPVAGAGGIRGAGRRPRYVLGTTPWHDAAAAAASPVLAAGRTVVAILPTFEEAAAAADALAGRFGERVVRASTQLPNRDVTAAWVRAATAPGTFVVGTAEAALWPVAAPGLLLVIEEGRRGMKAKQTPTVHVRDLARRRSLVEGIPMQVFGTVPTVEAVGTGIEVVAPPGRVWPLVEIAARGAEPPGAGLLLEHTTAAIRGIVARGGSVFVFTPRRGYAPAFRCVACGEMRRCAVCGSGPGRGEACVRCGAPAAGCGTCGGERFAAVGAGAERILEDLRRNLGGKAGPAGTPAPVRVGTERDLVDAGPVDLSVVVDADGLLLAPHYRAEEDALRVMARVAGLVGKGRGRRCLVQTAQPEHPVFAALRRGDPMPFLRDTVAVRADAGFPPAGEIVVVEATPAPAAADRALRGIVGEQGTVLGPAGYGDGLRWLLQGRDLRAAKVLLRGLVQDWRDAGSRVRVDADPIDL